MNDLKHTVEDAMSLPSPHIEDQAANTGVAAEDTATVGIEALEYYRRLHGRHTLYARVALLTVIFVMLGANMFLTQRNYHALLINMDQSRLAQADLIDRQLEMVEQHERTIARLEARMAVVEDALSENSEVVAVAD